MCLSVCSLRVSIGCCGLVSRAGPLRAEWVLWLIQLAELTLFVLFAHLVLILFGRVS